MNKTELVATIAKHSDVKQTTVDKVIDGLAHTIRLALQAGDDVRLPSLGIFSVAVRSGRTGRNPATGESIEIPARKVAKFKSSKDLKEALRAA